MAEEAPRTSLCLHKESRIEFDGRSEAGIIQIQIPSTGTFSRTSRNPRRVLRRHPTSKDEATFQQSHVASSSSLFSRSSDQFPRSLLWRLLDDDKVLDIRSADLTSKDGGNEPSFVIQLHFPVPLRREAVTLVEGISEIIEVYALTKGNEIYTVSLRPSFFYYEKATEINAERWAKAYKPASFTMCTAHRLLAADSKQIIISLSDGRLMRLTRKDGEDGTQWQERTFNDGQWGSSLRGLVRWQGNNAIRYEGATLDQATALTGALSPDGKHVYTVCMNHTLKTWDLETGKCVFTNDLLDLHREPQEVPELMIDPASSNLLKLFKVEAALEGDEYYIITHSPHDLGQFKVWAVRDANAGSKGIRDLFPEETLRPPDPESNPDSKAVWKVNDFDIGVSEIRKHMNLWVLMKSSRRYRLFHLGIDVASYPSSMPSDWQSSWTTVAPETMYDQPEPQVSRQDSEDVMRAWIDFLYFPGRCSRDMLETALSIYRSSRKWIPAPRPREHLQERLCKAISSDVKPDRFKNHADPQQQYHLALHQEWSILWQDIQDVKRQLWKATSMAYDEREDMAWLLFTGGCAAIRSCDQIERIAQNAAEDLAQSGNLLPLPTVEDGQPQDVARYPDELAVVVDAAADFCERLSYTARSACEVVLSNELWQEPTLSMPDRIQAVYDQCCFDKEVDQDGFDGLNEALAQVGGFHGLENGHFEAIIDGLPTTMASAPSGLKWTYFGSKLFETATRECVNLHKRFLTDLLLMAVFLNGEADDQGNPIISINAARIYASLLERLKEYEVIHWLSAHLQTPSSSDPQSIDSSTSVTFLESLFSKHIYPQENTSQSQSEALTNTIGDVLTYINGRSQGANFDEAITLIQCELLARGNLELAIEFSRFLPGTAWSTYVKGRMYLMREGYDEASSAFKQAAWKLSRPSNFHYVEASAGLLTPDFASFGNGLSRYYEHIATLPSFSPPYVAAFASLGLQTLPSDDGDSEKPDWHRTFLLKTLFRASLTTQDFDAAFSTLTRLPSSQARAFTPELVDAMISMGSFPRLLTYPWLPRLGDVVDSYLSSKASTFTPSPPTKPTTTHAKPHPGPSSSIKSLTVYPDPSSSSSPQNPHSNYPHLLASFRISREDHRGAAATLVAYLLRLQKLERSGRWKSSSLSSSHQRRSFPNSSQQQQSSSLIEQGKTQARKLLFARATAASSSHQQQDLPLTKDDKADSFFFEEYVEPTFLFAINSLLCAGETEDERWVFVGGKPDSHHILSGDDDDADQHHGDGGKQKNKGKEDGNAGGITTGEGIGVGKLGKGLEKRRIVTLKDVRGWYQEELDRRSKIERGRWGFGGGVDDGRGEVGEARGGDGAAAGDEEEEEDHEMDVDG